MKIEQRQKHLERLFKSQAGDAVIEELEELEAFLRDITNVPMGKNVEIEVKANMRAAIKIQEKINQFKRLKNQEKAPKKTTYL